MENSTVPQLMLKTAFSCMACDGDIDPREVEMIRSLVKTNALFQGIDLQKELDTLLNEINEDGSKFLRIYFKELVECKLNQEQELQLISIAVDTIKADDIIEYSELKFFKVIRSKLAVSNEEILKKFSDLEEFLEEDIMSASYLSNLLDDYFSVSDLPKFEKISFKKD